MSNRGRLCIDLSALTGQTFTAASPPRGVPRAMSFGPIKTATLHNIKAARWIRFVSCAPTPVRKLHVKVLTILKIFVFFFL